MSKHAISLSNWKAQLQGVFYRIYPRFAGDPSSSEGEKTCTRYPGRVDRSPVRDADDRCAVRAQLPVSRPIDFRLNSSSTPLPLNQSSKSRLSVRTSLSLAGRSIGRRNGRKRYSGHDDRSQLRDANYPGRVDRSPLRGANDGCAPSWQQACRFSFQD